MDQEIIKGTLRFQGPISDYYQRFHFVQKPRRPVTPESLVILFLEGDDPDDFPQSRLDYWLESATEFLEGKTYRTVEHRDLLLIAFRKFLMDKE